MRSRASAAKNRLRTCRWSSNLHQSRLWNSGTATPHRWKCPLLALSRLNLDLPYVSFDPKRTSTGSCTASLTDPEAAVSRSCRTAPARRKAHRRQRPSAGRTAQVRSSRPPHLGSRRRNFQLLAKFWFNANQPQGSRPDQPTCYKRACSEAWQHTTSSPSSRRLETAHYLLDEWDRESPRTEHTIPRLFDLGVDSGGYRAHQPSF